MTTPTGRPYVKQQRKPFPTLLPNEQEWNKLVVPHNEKRTEENRRSALEAWQANLKKYGNKWKVIHPSKVPERILSLNTLPMTDRDNRKYFPNLRYREDCKSVELAYPKDLSLGVWWAQAIPDYLLIEGSSFLPYVVDTPSETKQGNQYEHDIVPCLYFFLEGSIVENQLRFDTMNVKAAESEKTPYRQGDYKKNDAPIVPAAPSEEITPRVDG